MKLSLLSVKKSGIQVAKSQDITQAKKRLTRLQVKQKDRTNKTNNNKSGNPSCKI